MSLGVAPTSASAPDAEYQKVSLNPPLVISHPPSVSIREQGAFTTVGLPPSVVLAAVQPCCNCIRALASTSSHARRSPKLSTFSDCVQEMRPVYALPPPHAAPDAVSAAASHKDPIVRLTRLTIQQATAAHPEGRAAARQQDF